MAERQQQAAGGFSAPLLEGTGPVPFMSVARTADDVRRILESRGITDPGTLRILDAARELRAVSDYFGGRIASSLASAPPVVVEVSQETMNRIMEASGTPFVAGAFYLPGTNVVLTSPTLESSPSARDDVLTHEINHYVSYLGRGGVSMIFEFPPGTGYTLPSPPWMEEGLTEFFTSRMLGSRSMSIDYPCETVTMALLEHIVGADTVRDAFTGSGRGYDGLREALDARLGTGTFMTLVGLAPLPGGRTITNGAEALEFLSTRADMLHVDIMALASDPIYRMAFPPRGPGTGSPGPQTNR